MSIEMQVNAVCPFCDRRIKLVAMKDFESHSGIEMLEHYRRWHPEKVREGSTTMPYARREFVH